MESLMNYGTKKRRNGMFEEKISLKSFDFEGAAFFFDLRVKCSNCPVMANCKLNRDQLMALINPNSPSFVCELTVKFNVSQK